MSNFLTYVQEHQNRFLEELFSLIRIPSISAEIPFNDKSEIESVSACAAF